jgi:glutamate/tyrosine decarboxylase-like PLP-dependent enzyme
MDTSRLADAIASDRRAGLVPMAVCANAGATNTGAVDPLAEIGALCRQQAAWFHVDAAYGGFSVLTPRGRELLRGIESADSITLDPHKWLFQPYETGCLMVRDGDLMEAAFHVLPEYLQDTRMGRRQVNFADRGLQLTRAFRALRVWMSIETFGTRAHAHAIETAIQLAARAGDRVESSACLELLSPPSLGIVCFRFRPGPGWEGDLNTLNARLQERINREGAAMMSSTRLAGEYALRLCILNYRSSWEDVESTLERIEEIGEELIS